MARTSAGRADIRQLLKQAARHVVDGQFVEVVRLLAPRFDRRRPNERLALLLAGAYRRLGNHVLALEALKATEDRRGPTYDVAYMQGAIHEEYGQTEDAVEAYRTALECWPESVAPRVCLAEMALRAGDVAMARRWTRLSEMPAGIDPRLTFLRGMAFMKDGLYFEAQREFEMARDAGLEDVRLAPALKEVADALAERRAHLQEISAHLEAGPEGLPAGLAHPDFAEDYVTTLMNVGRRQEALRYVEEAVARFPVNAGLHSLHARVLLDSGRYEEGLTIASRVSDLEGDLDFVEWCIEQVKGLVGEREERLVHYESRAAQETDAETRAVLFANAAILETEQGNAAHARKLAASAVEARPESRGALEAAAHVAGCVGDHSEAVALYRRCAAKWPHAKNWLSVGVAYHNLGDAAEAHAAFRRALEISPDFDVPHCNLAILAMSAGDLERAARECRLALDANSNSVKALQLLKECHLRLGRLNEAEEVCEHLLDMPAADAVDAWRAMGNIWEARGDMERAIEYYLKAMDEKPDDRRLVLDVARLCARHEMFDDAERFLRQALKQMPSHPVILDTLGQMRIRQGRLAQGVRLLRRAVRNAPDVFEPVFHLGQALMSRGAWTEARLFINRALSIRPYSGEAMAARGHTLKELGDHEAAVRSFRDGLKCDPKNFDLLRGLALMFFEPPQGKWATAAEARRCLHGALGSAADESDAKWVIYMLERLDAQAPPSPEQAPVAQPQSRAPAAGPLSDPPGPRVFARQRYDERYAEAVAPAWPGAPTHTERLITRAIQLGSSPDLFFQRALTRAYLGSYAEAVPDLSEVIRLNPNHGGAFFERGVLHDALGDTEAALTDFHRAVALDPRRVEAYGRRGDLLLRLGHVGEAASDFTSTLALRDDLVSALWGRARALIAMDRPGLAVDDLTRALEASPDSAEIFNDRGECLRRLGDAQAALADFEAAIRLAPGLSVAVGNRCLLLVAMGRGLEAQAELRRSLASSPGDERLLAAWKRITSPA